MALAVYENFKGFASSRPPLMVFMICLGFFAVVLLSLAYYVKISELRSPDISQDWNVFLENFAELEFCITGNNTDAVPAAPMTTTMLPTTTTTRGSTSSLNEGGTSPHSVDYEGMKNYSVSMLLIVQPTKKFVSIPHNVTHVTGVITGRDIGLDGDAAEEAVNVTVELAHNWNSTHCTEPYGCDNVPIYTCVHFSASSSVFPMSKSPPMCEGLNETGIEWYARMMAQKPKQSYTTYYCRSRPVIRIKHNFDPTLSMWLSMHERSVINLHLMHTSYFLFVMVVTLFCYAVIRGRPHKTKYAQTEKVSTSSQA